MVVKRRLSPAPSMVRAFVRLREMMGANKEVAEKLGEVERKVTSHDEAIRSLVQAIRQPMAPSEQARHSIGFRVEEAAAAHGRLTDQGFSQRRRGDGRSGEQPPADTSTRPSA